MKRSIHGRPSIDLCGITQWIWISDLKPGSREVDAAVPIPTVNDGFTGRAPDLGALELGKPEPHYGPRRLTWQPFYR